MLSSEQVDENNYIQKKLSELLEKGWTKASIADEIGVAHVTVEKWCSGERHARLEKPIMHSLDQLFRRKRIPPKKRYAKGSRKPT